MWLSFLFSKNITTISHRDEYIKLHQNPKSNTNHQKSYYNNTKNPTSHLTSLSRSYTAFSFRPIITPKIIFTHLNAQNTRLIFYITKITLTIYIHSHTFTINNIINSCTYTKIHCHSSNFNFYSLP